MTDRFLRFFAVEERLTWRGWVVILSLLSIAIVSRKPDLLFNAQFFGDEATWFKQAYELGALRSLFIVQDGYLVIGLRLPDILAAHLPFSLAPGIGQLYTLIVKVLCVAFLMTARLSCLGSLATRMALAFLWIAVPNAQEVETLNNVQWYLAVLGMLLLFSAPVSHFASLLNWSIMCIIALTGPFCIMLLPFGLTMIFLRKQLHTIVLTIILSLGGIAQAWMLLHHLNVCQSRMIAFNYVSKIVVAQIFLLGVIGNGWSKLLLSLVSPAATWQSWSILVCGFCLLAYAGYRGTLFLRLFLAYATLTLLACGEHLHCSGGWSSDSLLLSADYCARYWYIERLSVLAALLTMLSRVRPLALRVLGTASMTMVLLVSLYEWRYPPWIDYHFKSYAKVFEHAPKGKVVTIPVNPGWQLILVKH